MRGKPRSPRVGARSSGRDAFVNVTVGLVFFVLGLPLTGIVLWATFGSGGTAPFSLGDFPMLLLALLLTSFIWIVGSSMLIQGVGRRPGVEGFAYVLSARLLKRSSPAALWTAALLYGLFAGAWTRLDAGPTTQDGWQHMLAIPALVLFHVVFHELRHFVVAARLGLRPFRLIAGPVAIDRRTGAWTLGANRQWLYLIGGVVEFVPARGARAVAQVAAAGPLATLMLLGVGWLLGQALPHRSSLVAELVGANQAIALGTLVFNLWPMRLGNLSTDGLLLLNYLRRR